MSRPSIIEEPVQPGLLPGGNHFARVRSMPANTIRERILEFSRSVGRDFYAADAAKALGISSNQAGAHLARMPEIACIKRRRFAHHEPGHTWGIRGGANADFIKP